MDSETSNPFMPGAGLFPPVLAGRNKELGALKQRLKRIRARGLGDIVVMYGPRGNGKTSLLSELETLAVREGVEVREFEPNPLESGNRGAPWQLAEGETTPIETTTTGVAGVANVLSGSRKVTKVSVAESAGSIREMARTGPLLLLVDEAHELPADFGKALLHSTQGCVKARLPLLAVFAGTPGLQARFRAMHASFWERAFPLEIGRLVSDDEVREALTVPAKRAGRPIDDDALELLVRESQRYPFFIQLAGATAWEAASERSEDCDRITVADVQAGLDDANKRRIRFYNLRRAELLDEDVLDAAEAVSQEMVSLNEGEALPLERLTSALDSVVASGADIGRAEMQRRLVNLGLIWETGDLSWEPGIPSLCAHLVKHRGRR